mgnify:CR=1 FL=1
MYSIFSKKSISFFLFVLFISVLWAKADVSDDYVKIYGQVLSTDKSPIESTINLTYQMQPYGNEYGILTIENSKGNFEFMVRRDQDYNIQANANGYASSSQVIAASELKEIGQKGLKVEIYLMPAEPGLVIRLDQLLFDQGKFKIKQNSYNQLNDLTTTMQNNPEMVIQIEGHTDYIGGDEQNMKLSQQRVDEVKYYLETAGIQSKRLKTKAFGGTQPLHQVEDEELRKLNRRVEVRILEI